MPDDVPMTDETATEPTSAAEETPPTPPPPPWTPGRWRLVSLIAGRGMEPSCELTEEQARCAWAVRSAPWHPALLAEAAEVPLVEDVYSPSTPASDQVRIVAAGARDKLPSGYEIQVAESGAILIEGEADRIEIVKQIAARMQTPEAPALGDPSDPLVLDFLALGTARCWLRDLTVAMGHTESLDTLSLEREAISAARAWRDNDRTAASGHLRASFEILTQARERFFPIDAYLIDVCLLDPNLPAGALADPLAAHTPVTFLGPARAFAAQGARDPERMAELNRAIDDGWADVIGGPFGEIDEPLRPLESVLWQFRKGHETYRQHLLDRAVETFARRRFGLYPQLPQVAKRFGFRFALHWGLDEGRFPVPAEMKRLWEAPDSSYVESLIRTPIAADREVEGARFPWRLARTMKDDNIATLPLVHWPSPVADWFRDLRRILAYSPVFGRAVTANDYFSHTDRPWEMFRPTPDDYITPFLVQAVARLEPTAITRRVTQTILRARVDALNALRAVGRSLGVIEPEETPAASAQAVEDAAESGRFDEATSALETLEPAWAGAVARAVGAVGTPGTRPGYLILNPTGVHRTAAVLLPGASADLRPEGPLRCAQLATEGVWAILDLPAFGYAWVPRETNVELPAVSPSVVGASDRVLRNGVMEVEIDNATGGIRSIRAPGETSARIGQQLAIFGLTNAEGEPAPSRMRSDRFEIDFAGPALVQAMSEGTLHDPADERVLARFHQRFRLWNGRPILDLDITLSELDPTWIARLAAGDPWRQYLACRWAWPDPDANLRRTLHLAPTETSANRPETPDAIDMSVELKRVALLFGGLAHHRRHGTRMLDTLLVAGHETGRRFKLGVALDQDFPHQAVVDRLAPAFVVPTETGPPASGPVGWFFQLDSRSIAVTRVEPLEDSGDGRGWGVAFHLLETTGRPTRCRIRLIHSPIWARQTDFNGELIVDLPIDGDAVTLDFTPHELARVDITLGAKPAPEATEPTETAS